jgi:hypothetical protein
MNTQLTSVLSKLIFGTLLFLAVAPANAQSPFSVVAAVRPSASVAGDKDSMAMVKYLGLQDDMIIFNISYKNPGGAAFSVVVQDEEGSQLYQSVFKEKDFSKQFRLPRTDRSKVVFIIRDLKATELARVFEINVNSHYIDEVAVKKVDY